MSWLVLGIEAGAAAPDDLGSVPASSVRVLSLKFVVIHQNLIYSVLMSRTC